MSREPFSSETKRSFLPSGERLAWYSSLVPPVSFFSPEPSAPTLQRLRMAKPFCWSSLRRAWKRMRLPSGVQAGMALEPVPAARPGGGAGAPRRAGRRSPRARLPPHPRRSRHGPLRGRGRARRDRGPGVRPLPPLARARRPLRAPRRRARAAAGAPGRAGRVRRGARAQARLPAARGLGRGGGRGAARRAPRPRLPRRRAARDRARGGVLMAIEAGGMPLAERLRALLARRARGEEAAELATFARL